MAENTNLRLTVEAWADILTEHWLDRMHKLKIGSSFELENSIRYSILGGEVPTEVRMMFNYYGKFVDMGVGAGVPLGAGQMARQDYAVGEGGSRRRPKKWYSKTFFAEVKRLAEILGEKYARLGTLTIVENYDDNALKWRPDTI